MLLLWFVTAAFLIVAIFLSAVLNRRYGHPIVRSLIRFYYLPVTALIGVYRLSLAAGWITKWQPVRAGVFSAWADVLMVLGFGLAGVAAIAFTVRQRGEETRLVEKFKNGY